MGNSSTASISIETTLQSIREAIWSRRPILGEIMRKHGDMNLFDYARDFMDVNDAPVHDPYKPEIIDVLSELIGQRLGSDVGERVKKQLKKFALVSTADHHATIDHPFWVNSNIISALPFLSNPQPDVFSLIVLSFAGVSLNNASGFPRGILFHGGSGNSTNLIRLPFLPDKLKMGIVWNSRGFTADDLRRASESLAGKVAAGDIPADRCAQVQLLIDRYFAASDVLAAPDLNTQITKVNYRLWPTFFHPAQGSEDTAGHPLDLIYFEIETLVTELLLRRHLYSDTLLNRLLFRDDLRALAQKHFDGIAGAFSLKDGWGTYMFWAIDAHGHRVRLELDGNWLRSKTRPELSVEFTPDAIADALRKKSIYPSMLLCYVMVSLYYGMKCLGGFCQVHDLTVTKSAWADLLLEVGEQDEAEALAPIQTKELGGDGMVLAYKKTAAGELFPATGIDMALAEWDTSADKYLERSKTVTLSEMMNPMLPEMYTVLYSSYERDERFLSISPEQITRETGLADKLTRERYSHS